MEDDPVVLVPPVLVVPPEVLLSLVALPPVAPAPPWLVDELALVPPAEAVVVLPAPPPLAKDELDVGVPPVPEPSELPEHPAANTPNSAPNVTRTSCCFMTL
jgi:hypothetical protein